MGRPKGGLTYKPWFHRSTGYYYVRADDYPDGRRRVMPYHRWLMERHLRRPLSRDEQVHHINGDRTDNRIENLEVLSASEHQKHHWEILDAGGRSAIIGPAHAALEARGFRMSTPQERRAAVLLVDVGFSIAEAARILDRKYHTVYKWVSYFSHCWGPR